MGAYSPGQLDHRRHSEIVAALEDAGDVGLADTDSPRQLRLRDTAFLHHRGQLHGEGQDGIFDPVVVAPASLTDELGETQGSSSSMIMMPREAAAAL